MIRPATDIEVFLYAEPVDMRKSIDGLACLIEQETELSPFDSRLFVFCNRGRNKIKLLLWYKRLEKYRFQWPDKDMPATIDGRLLNDLLDGYDIRPRKLHPALHYSTMV